LTPDRGLARRGQPERYWRGVGTGMLRGMTYDGSEERTETDERVEENRTPAPVAPVSRDDADVEPGTGLTRGQHADDASPLDRGKPLDPFGGKAPSERIPG
jgi:hypothetical protein